MRADMIAGLRTWRDAPAARDRVIETRAHAGWDVDVRRAPLGVVGFVFEGRPNVFADAAGVVRTGNTAVFRIGSDALGTARAIVEHALDPALAAAGLPVGTLVLVDSAERSAGWALFGDRRLALAVARGSGSAVAQLGAVARQAGVAVSLHGTGGAWLVAGETADPDRLHHTLVNSLDRKVCNTVNVCCIPRTRAADLVPVVVAAIDEAAAGRGTSGRLHVETGSVPYVDASHFTRRVVVRRADGDHDETFASPITADELANEWEWEHSPEMALVVVDDVDAAVRLCNRHSPRFIASLISLDRRGARPLLRGRRCAVRRRRVHAVGRWPVRTRHAGARPVELGARPSPGAWRDPVRGVGPHPALPGVGRRPDDPPLTAEAHALRIRTTHR